MLGIGYGLWNEKDFSYILSGRIALFALLLWPFGFFLNSLKELIKIIKE